MLDNRTRSELEVCHVDASDYSSFLEMDRIASCTQDRTSSYSLRVGSQKKQNDCSHTTKSKSIVMTIESNSRPFQSP